MERFNELHAKLQTKRQQTSHQGDYSQLKLHSSEERRMAFNCTLIKPMNEDEYITLISDRICLYSRTDE